MTSCQIYINTINAINYYINAINTTNNIIINDILINYII